MKISFLRHGPTEWNAQGRVQGHTDIPLSREGALLVATRALPDEIVSARAFVSTLTRARQTAELLGIREPTQDARLMEQHWGQWEGLTREEIAARDGADAFARAGRGAQFRPPGGESIGEVLARLRAFLGDVAQGEGDAVAVAHLGVLRAAYTLATGWTMETPMPNQLDAAKILILSLARDGTPAIAELNCDFARKA